MNTPKITSSISTGHRSSLLLSDMAKATLQSPLYQLARPDISPQIVTVDMRLHERMMRCAHQTLADGLERGFIGYLDKKNNNLIVAKKDQIGSTDHLTLELIVSQQYQPYLMFHTHPDQNDRTSTDTANPSVQDWITFISNPSIEFFMISSAQGELIAIKKEADSKVSQRVDLKTLNSLLEKVPIGHNIAPKHQEDLSRKLSTIFNKVQEDFKHMRSWLFASVVTGIIAKEYRLSVYRSEPSERILIMEN